MNESLETKVKGFVGVIRQDMPYSWRSLLSGGGRDDESCGSTAKKKSCRFIKTLQDCLLVPTLPVQCATQY